MTFPVLSPDSGLDREAFEPQASHLRIGHAYPEGGAVRILMVNVMICSRCPLSLSLPWKAGGYWKNLLEAGHPAGSWPLRENMPLT